MEYSCTLSKYLLLTEAGERGLMRGNADTYFWLSHIALDEKEALI